MAFKKLILLLILFISAEVSFGQNQDSVIYLVFNALTADAGPLPKNTDKLLDGHEWEALAYWDSQEEKVFENMHEAVGDIYQFISTQFSIKAVNPNNSKEYLTAINGTFVRKGSVITLKSQSGKEMMLNLIFIDEHYLILEMDGLRIFFTQTRSFQSN
jgi:hypothetical protein